MAPNRARIPELQLREAFANTAHAGLFQYVQESTNRFRFEDARYDQYKCWPLEGQEPSTLVASEGLSHSDKNARYRCLHKLSGNENNHRYCQDEDIGAELTVLRD